MISQQIIDVLNKDPEARAFKAKFEQKMIEYGLSEKEKQEKKTFMLMVCIHNNPEAKKIMVEGIYNELRAQ